MRHLVFQVPSVELEALEDCENATSGGMGTLRGYLGQKEDYGRTMLHTSCWIPHSKA